MLHSTPPEHSNIIPVTHLVAHPTDPACLVCCTFSSIYLWRNGTWSLLAGSDFEVGFKDATGPAARFESIHGCCFYRDFLIVAEELNHCIRAVSLATAAVTTFAGIPTEMGADDGPKLQARFHYPGSVVHHDGSLWVGEVCTGKIRNIADGRVTTYFSADGSNIGITQFVISPLVSSGPASWLAAVTDTNDLCVIKATNPPRSCELRFTEYEFPSLSPFAITTKSVSPSSHFIFVAVLSNDDADADADVPTIPAHIRCFHVESGSSVLVHVPGLCVTDALTMALNASDDLVINANDGLLNTIEVSTLFSRPPVPQRTPACSAWLSPYTKFRLLFLFLFAEFLARPADDPMLSILPPEIWWLIIRHEIPWSNSNYFIQ